MTYPFQGPLHMLCNLLYVHPKCRPWPARKSCRLMHVALTLRAARKLDKANSPFKVMDKF